MENDFGSTKQCQCFIPSSELQKNCLYSLLFQPKRDIGYLLE